MAWDDDMPLILRTVIQDVAATPVYTDDRLVTQILVTVPLLLLRVSFPNAYSVDISNGTLTPDPTRVTPRDNAFISLACLMAAKNLVGAELRDMTRQGIEIQDGDSKIKLARDPASLRLMKEEFETQFDEAMYAYKTGGDAGLGLIITGPYKMFENWPQGAGSLYEGYPGGRRGGCFY